MSDILHPSSTGEPTTTTTTTNNGGASPEQVELGLPQRSFDDATASKTEYDSTAEEKKKSLTRDDVQIDGDTARIVGAAAGHGAETATQEEGEDQGGIIYLHGIRFVLIAIWYVSFSHSVSRHPMQFHDFHLKSRSTLTSLHITPPSHQATTIRARRTGRREIPETSQTATSCYAEGDCW